MRQLVTKKLITYVPEHAFVDWKATKHSMIFLLFLVDRANKAVLRFCSLPTYTQTSWPNTAKDVRLKSCLIYSKGVFFKNLTEKKQNIFLFSRAPVSNGQQNGTVRTLCIHLSWKVLKCYGRYRSVANDSFHFSILKFRSITIMLKHGKNVTRNVTVSKVTRYRSFFAQKLTSYRYSYLKR